MNKKILSFGVLIILLIIGLSGCTNQISNDNNGDYKYSESYEKELKVDDNSTLIVSTINGKIKIIGWENNDIKINGLKKANDPDGIEKIKFQIDSNNSTVSLTVTHEIDVGLNAAFDLELKVPSSIRIERIDSINGKIEVSKVPNIWEIVTTNGAIDVKLIEINNPIFLQSTNGDIDVYTDIKNNATFDMRTTNGQIINNKVPFDWTHNSSTYKQGNIGIGLFPVNIITTNGDIILHKLQD